MILLSFAIGFLISIVDLRVRRIPRLISSFTFLIFIHWLTIPRVFLGVFNYAFFLALFLIFRNGLGYGDVRLSFLVAVMWSILKVDSHGLTDILKLDFLAILLAALYSTIRLKSFRDRTPLAPAFFTSLLLNSII